MWEIAGQSENKTLHVFSQVYRRMAVLSREPISSLYGDIRRYVQVNETQDDAFGPVSGVDIKLSVTRFFTDLFPLVHHHHVNTLTRDFSFDYKVCLKETVNEVRLEKLPIRGGTQK